MAEFQAHVFLDFDEIILKSVLVIELEEIPYNHIEVDWPQNDLSRAS